LKSSSNEAEKKIKLWDYTIKTFVRVEVLVYTYVTLTLDEGKSVLATFGQ
jgi:hypothetical protein